MFWDILSTVWIIAWVALIVIYAALVLVRLVRFLRAAVCPVRDRGMATCNLENGVSVLYVPSVAAQRFLRQYQLIAYETCAEKKFLGEWACHVGQAEYSLIVYDRYGVCIDVIRVRERADGKRMTAVTDLPPRTDFVSVRLHRVDGERVREPVRVGAFFLWFSILLVGIAVGVAALLFLVMAIIYASQGNIPFGTMAGYLGIVAALIVGVPLLAAAAWFAVLKLRKRMTRSRVRSDRAWISECMAFLRAGYGRARYFLTRVGCAVGNAFRSLWWSAPVRLLRPYAAQAGKTPAGRRKERGRRHG